MDSARILSCPGCGGPVSSDARHCGYCRSPILTVRCARCYAMNSPDAAHCSGCGFGLGLSPIGDSDALSCPDCKLPLESFFGGPGVLRDCGKCGGQFVDHALLRDLIERREVYGEAAPRHSAKKNPMHAPVRYRPCPACAHLMNRRNFGRSSGVVVDQCTAHGTWFDAGELPQVLAFIESGGLARARRRELEEFERRKRQAAAAAVVPIMATSSSEFSVLDAEYRASLLSDAAEVVVILLEAVVGLFTKK